MSASRLYLPSLCGDQIVQIGCERAVIMALHVARDMHLPWVEGMASRAEQDGAAGFPKYWQQARDDLRWAIDAAEARLAEQDAALARQAVRA